MVVTIVPASTCTAMSRGKGIGPITGLICDKKQTYLCLQEDMAAELATFFHNNSKVVSTPNKKSVNLWIPGVSEWDRAYLSLRTYVMLFVEKCFLPKNFFWGSVRLIPEGDMSNSTKWAGETEEEEVEVVFGTVSCWTTSLTISSPSCRGTVR